MNERRSSNEWKKGTLMNFYMWTFIGSLRVRDDLVRWCTLCSLSVSFRHVFYVALRLLRSLCFVLLSHDSVSFFCYANRLDLFMLLGVCMSLFCSLFSFVRLARCSHNSQQMSSKIEREREREKSNRGCIHTNWSPLTRNALTKCFNEILHS